MRPWDGRLAGTPQAYKEAPWAPAQCQDFLRQAEAAAGVEKLDGGLWHRLPAEVGHGAEGGPAQGCRGCRGMEGRDHVADRYQHVDEATMLKVMELPVRLVSRRTAGVPEKR